MKNKTLFIPSNIETEKQIFDGIGILELTFIIGSFFMALTIALILKIVTDLSVSAMGLILLITIGISYLLAKKDNNNMSFLILIKNFYKFLSSQKNYKFKYRSEWFRNGDS